jgi:hypothetical protein
MPRARRHRGRDDRWVVEKNPESLTLPLLMPRIATHHVNRPLAADDFAVFTDSFYAGTYFHGIYRRQCFTLIEST